MTTANTQVLWAKRLLLAAAVILTSTAATCGGTDDEASCDSACERYGQCATEAGGTTRDLFDQLGGVGFCQQLCDVVTENQRANYASCIDAATTCDEVLASGCTVNATEE